jgi:peroxiredoxin
MRIAAGSKAPSFRRQDLLGAMIDTAAIEGPLWVGFFRFASCPLCNLRIHTMIGDWDRWQHRCTYVAVFQSPAERFTDFMRKQQPPFSVIADPELELFRAFNIESSVGAALKVPVIAETVRAKMAGFPVGALSAKDGAAFRVPADFIINNGTVTTAFYGSNVAESIPFDDADAALNALGRTRRAS